MPALVASVFLLASHAQAMPIRYTFQGFVEKSELIVVGRVDSIRGMHLARNRWARVKVIEVWKGPMIENVEFLASPRREPWRQWFAGCCYDTDISDAKKAESVLLFLIKEEGVGWVIMNKGRGRIRLHTWDGKAYATDFTAQMPTQVIPDGIRGSTSAVELATLRGSAKKILQNAR
ncbi:MAG: hypothetical protein ACLQVF_27205 [Isosphaeraceae bacterium]